MVGDHEAAEDLCQETFLKALRSWAQHDPQANAVAWIYRIATNTAYDHLRRHRRVRFTALVEQDPLPSGAHTMESRVAEGEPVRTTLEQLPARYRDLLVLHAYEGHSTREIATALGCTDIAVKMRLFRARARFREIYRDA
jgi:RNA polymerase sigma-70 factor, ECF subfamily